jgi:hypothetical protein
MQCRNYLKAGYVIAPAQTILGDGVIVVPTRVTLILPFTGD